MLLTESRVTGGYLQFNGPNDWLTPKSTLEAVTLNLKFPTYFMNCRIVDPAGAPIECVDEQGQNQALRIYDPFDANDANGSKVPNWDTVIQSDEKTYIVIMDVTFVRCYFPVIVAGKHCDIHYTTPAERAAVQQQNKIATMPRKQRRELEKQIKRNRKRKGETDKQRLKRQLKAAAEDKRINGPLSHLMADDASIARAIGDGTLEEAIANGRIKDLRNLQT